MFVSAGHKGISRAEEVLVALLVPVVPLVPLSCDVLMSPALTSAAGPESPELSPEVVGGASGTHDGLYKNSFESEINCKAL
jgi:hypothetical protein